MLKFAAIPKFTYGKKLLFFFNKHNLHKIMKNSIPGGSHTLFVQPLVEKK